MRLVCTLCQAHYARRGLERCPRDRGPLFPALTHFPEAPEDALGAVLDGRYIVREALSEGSMGLVMSAEHARLGATVAIKLMRPSLLEDPVAAARFLREAQTAARIDHPNVVRIQDFGVTPAGLHYLVMERLYGEDLYDRLRRTPTLEIHEVVALGVEACAALEALHTAGLVHRDLKPENIFLVDGAGPAGPRVKLLDLGVVDVSRAPARLTRTGTIVGTPAYMAPEQTRGERCDPRADLYALSAVLWECLTGERLFDASPSLSLMQHRHEVPRDPRLWRPEVPQWLAELVRRGLEKKRERRFPSASLMRAALEFGLTWCPPERSTPWPRVGESPLAAVAAKH